MKEKKEIKMKIRFDPFWLYGVNSETITDQKEKGQYNIMVMEKETIGCINVNVFILIKN